MWRGTTPAKLSVMPFLVQLFTSGQGAEHGTVSESERSDTSGAGLAFFFRRKQEAKHLPLQLFLCGQTCTSWWRSSKSRKEGSLCFPPLSCCFCQIYTKASKATAHCSSVSNHDHKSPTRFSSMLFPPPQRCTEPLKWSELLEKHCQTSGLLHGADILNLVQLLALQLCSTIYEMPNSCHWRETQSCSCRHSIIRKKRFVIISLLSGCKLDRTIQKWPCLFLLIPIHFYYFPRPNFFYGREAFLSLGPQIDTQSHELVLLKKRK